MSGGIPGSTKVGSNLREDKFEALYPGTSQKISFTNSSQPSTAFGLKTSLIRVFATQDCFLAFGSAPTALTDGTSMFIPGGLIDFIGVTPGQKLAVIESTTDGVLYITEAAG